MFCCPKNIDVRAKFGLSCLDRVFFAKASSVLTILDINGMTYFRFDTTE